MTETVYSATFLDRFWAKVDTSGGAAACWPWTGGTQHRHHGRSLVGRIRAGGAGSKLILAHRAALMIATGEDPPDKQAGHTVCDFSLCCNPTHLAWQDPETNSAEYRERYYKHWSYRYRRRGARPYRLGKVS